MRKKTLKHKGSILLLFTLSFAQSSFSQSFDSLSAGSKVKFMPAVKVGGNYTSFFTGEAGFLFGMTRKNLYKESKITSTMCHGPALGCEFGKPGDTLLIAPKFSYEYYSLMYGGRISVVSYMKGNSNYLYISPEAGISATVLNILAGVNIPVSGSGISEVSTFRLSVIVYLYGYLFKKDRPSN